MLSTLDFRPKPALDIEDMAPDGLVDVELADEAVVATGQLVGDVGDLAHKRLELRARPVGDELVAQRAAVEVVVRVEIRIEGAGVGCRRRRRHRVRVRAVRVRRAVERRALRAEAVLLLLMVLLLRGQVFGGQYRDRALRVGLRRRVVGVWRRWEGRVRSVGVGVVPAAAAAAGEGIVGAGP